MGFVPIDLIKLTVLIGCDKVLFSQKYNIDYPTFAFIKTSNFRRNNNLTIFYGEKQAR